MWTINCTLCPLKDIALLFSLFVGCIGRKGWNNSCWYFRYRQRGSLCLAGGVYACVSFVSLVCVKTKQYIYNVVHVSMQVANIQNTLFYLQAAGHHTVYAMIDHTKKGPTRAPPVEQYHVEYARLCSGGLQPATTAHSCECGITCKCGQQVYIDCACIE